MTTGIAGFIGFPPDVSVTERKLLSDIPEHERDVFVAYLGTSAQYTRSGEIVFSVREYNTWKAQLQQH